ncbi:MAG: ABC transporter ATP-binding protein [Desulfobacterales bacterium]|nr:ABC transporter ATP-binding protein [Desulfobacteraceae bacterium]MDY0311706.1 ABC transporter ATP-binding protein [Desulfobacterales bacterium]
MPMHASSDNQPNPPPLLHLEQVSKAFGGVRALTEISFEVGFGRIQGLIGPNGAGKTTLFNLVSGALKPDAGDIHFDGKPIQGRPGHELVALGIARTFQNVELFGSMSVLENVLVGRHVRTRCGFWGALIRHAGVKREEREAREKALELLAFVGLADQADSPSQDLPFGWQRLLEIARALAAEPRVLLLDEPAAGLNRVESDHLGDLIDRIRDQGITILMVEHDMGLTMRVCDRIVVLDHGRLLAQGTPREIQRHPDVLAAYLGKSPTST